MANRAVVATDVPGCREIVENEKNWFISETTGGRIFILGMKRLLNDSSLRERLARVTSSAAKTEFSDSVINPKWKNLYDNITRT